MCVYSDAKLRQWFEAAWKKSGKKLDMGKSCVRFRKIEDLALDVVGEAVARVPVDRYVEFYETAKALREQASTQRTRRKK
jgi:hypothetical protein